MLTNPRTRDGYLPRFLQFFALPRRADGPSTYTRTDGILALVYFVVLLTIYATFYRFAFLPFSKYYLEPLQGSPVFPIVQQSPLAIMVFLVAFAFVRFRGQDLSTIGISTSACFKSIAVGVCFSVPIFAVAAWQSAERHGNLVHLSAVQAVAAFAYHFLIIASVEEISFRGYIQSRLAGLISNRWVRTLVVAVIFSAFHVPIQSIIQRVPVLSYVQHNWLILSTHCVMHFYLLYVYQRTGNILSSITTHALNNFSCEFFLLT
jgi:uncharacterized protein